MSVNPNALLRYPGGKRRMLAFLQNYLPDNGKIDGHYIEPFIGGGAIFFCIQPKCAVLSDINSELIDAYKGIRYSPKRVWKLYCSFGNTKNDYKYVRDEYTPKNLTERAARILYLNRTCFKGMWRHNRDGNFNVGYGGQGRRWMITEQDLIFCASALRKAQFQCGDFESLVNKARTGDFLFLDPPYRPGCKEHTNSHYVWQQFKYEDYERLALSLWRAKSRGAEWALTISSHQDILSLFRRNYAIEIPHGTGQMPGIQTDNSGEVLITSYKIEHGKKL